MRLCEDARGRRHGRRPERLRQQTRRASRRASRVLERRALHRLHLRAHRGDAQTQTRVFRLQRRRGGRAGDGRARRGGASGLQHFQRRRATRRAARRAAPLPVRRGDRGERVGVAPRRRALLKGAPRRLELAPRRVARRRRRARRRLGVHQLRLQARAARGELRRALVSLGARCFRSLPREALGLGARLGGGARRGVRAFVRRRQRGVFGVALEPQARHLLRQRRLPRARRRERPLGVPLRGHGVFLLRDRALGVHERVRRARRVADAIRRGRLGETRLELAARRARGGARLLQGALRRVCARRERVAARGERRALRGVLGVAPEPGRRGLLARVLGSRLGQPHRSRRRRRRRVGVLG